MLKTKMAKLKIPLLDLSAQYRSIAPSVMGRVEAVIESQQFILGPEVSLAEEEIAQYCGVDFAVGVASGTDALILTLQALGVGPGDEVITTPFTFYATASSIVHAGARPVFVDIEPETCLIRPDAIEAAITERTRALLPVHLFGQCADMGAVAEIASRHGLSVLEDACQAIGAELDGVRAGSLGDGAALSFYPSKNLGGFGDGGMVLTGKEEVADKVRKLRVHGASKNDHEIIGVNSRLDSIQAAVLVSKLPHLDEWIRTRRLHAAQYDERFRGSAIKPLETRAGRAHAYNNYVVRVGRRAELMAFLSEQGIGCAIYYKDPLHKMACFSQYAPEKTLPESELAAQECLAIPVYPEMAEEAVDYVAGKVLGFYE